MPVDPEATVGTLPNGLRYYVRAEREARAGAPSCGWSSKPDRCSKTTTSAAWRTSSSTCSSRAPSTFRGRASTTSCRRSGLSIGADANAETSYDDTQYTLRVPTDTPGCSIARCSSSKTGRRPRRSIRAASSSERGIVLAEWRMHLGAGERTQDKIRRVQLEGSRYADRSPIGKPEIIQNAQREQLMRFYHDWYRPDLMAVIVVGDFDRDAVVAMIKPHFSSLTNPVAGAAAAGYDVPDHPGTRYAIVTDKETTSTTVELSDLRPARNQGSVGGYREHRWSISCSPTCSARGSTSSARARTRRSCRAAADRGLFQTPRTKDEALLQALVTNDGIATRPRGSRDGGPARRAVRLHRHRARPREAGDDARLRARRRRKPGPRVGEPRRRVHAQLSPRTKRCRRSGRSSPSTAASCRRSRSPKSTRSPRTGSPIGNRLVVVSAPDAAGVTLPTKRSSRRSSKAAAAKKLEAVRRCRGRPDADGRAAAARHDRQDHRPRRGRHHRMDAVERREGRAQADDAQGGSDPVPRRRAGRHVARQRRRLHSRPRRPMRSSRPAASAQFNAVVLDKMLAGKAVAVSPFIDELDQGMAGGSTPQDLETMFQLIYLRFTQPRADPTAFAAMASQARSLLANQMASPDVVFNQTLDAALSGNNPRRQPETPATVDQWNLEKSMAFYKARFADASNFTFVFVGSFTPETHQAAASRPTSRACRRRTRTRPGGISASRRRRRDREDRPAGHRAEEPGGDRLLRAVRVRRSRTAWRSGR